MNRVALFIVFVTAMGCEIPENGILVDPDQPRTSLLLPGDFCSESNSAWKNPAKNAADAEDKFRWILICLYRIDANDPSATLSCDDRNDWSHTLSTSEKIKIWTGIGDLLPSGHPQASTPYSTSTYKCDFSAKVPGQTYYEKTVYIAHGVAP